MFPADYERMTYVEPFCGAAAVLFAKRRSRCEYLNDRDEELLNFLFTVKMHSRELYRTLRLIPNSRMGFARFMDSRMGASSILRAARFWYLNRASMDGLREQWAYQGHSGGAASISNLQRSVLRDAIRLRDVILDCSIWQEEVEKLDCPATLFYFDPPYLETEGYANAFGENDWRELRAAMDKDQGKFVLSAEGTKVMQVLWRGFKQRLTSVTSSLGPNGRKQSELLVWNY